jgi:catechol 2,3-dioxygenase-like lactoylglutathione lyase family enzyme
MIGYTTLGTCDLERSCKFYDPIFAEMGQDQCWRDDQVACWGDTREPSKPRFFIAYPFDENIASVGNGSMIAFIIDSAAKIDRIFEIAANNGGRSDGDPGLRPQYGACFYAAYLRDPDGNKLAFVCYDA